MTIKEVSEMFEISADTLRYYEKVGLIPRIHRNSNGIRNYSTQDLAHIEFIKCMRQAGLGIDVLSTYVTLYVEGDQTASQRKDILINQRVLLLDRMNDLKKTLDRLDYKIERYEKALVASNKTKNK